VLRAVLVTPLSGPLGRYGVDGAEALALWAEEVSGPPTAGRTVALTRFDAHPDAAAAMRAALETHPDLVFGPYGSGPAMAALRASADRVVWNHGGSASAISWRRFPRVVNVPAPANTYLHGALEAVCDADRTIASVVLLHGATTFGRDVATGARKTAARLQLRLTCREFRPGTAATAAAKLPSAEVVLLAGGFDDELAAAGVLLERPWRAAAFVGAGVDDVLDRLGDRMNGVLGPAQWMPEVAPMPDEGPDVAWFVGRYRRRTGRNPSYPAAQAFAAGLLASRCVRDAGVPVRDAPLFGCARRLECTTLFGPFGLDPDTGHQRRHAVVTVQWQGGRRVPVWPVEIAQASVRIGTGGPG